MASLNPRSGLLGFNLASHLLRRATYNINKSQIEHFANLNVNQALDELLDYTSFSTDDFNLPEPIASDTGTFFVNSGSSNLDSFSLNLTTSSWYLNEARHSTTLRFKLTTFLHSIFIVNGDGNSKSFYDYILLLTYYSKESYKELAYKITYINKMLSYLSNQFNIADSPNEDYAREFLELFTIMRGEQIAAGDYTNYTEHDVQMAARVLTGYRRKLDRTVIDSDTGIPTGIAVFSRHDTGDKTFSHAFGNHTIVGAVDQDDMFRELQDFVDMIFNQDATAKSICRRMYRYFVRRNIDEEVENDIISPLATILKDNDYNLEITIRTLLSSQHFFDEDDSIFGDEIIGSLVKTPMDLLLQSFNLLEINLPDPTNEASDFYVTSVAAHRYFMRFSDMYLFFPANVSGYKAIYQESDYDMLWFNFNTIETRFSIGKSIVKRRQYFRIGSPVWNITFDLVLFIRDSGNFSDPGNAETLINETYELLLIETPEPFRHDYFFEEVFLKTLSTVNWSYEWSNYISSGDDSSVRGHLEDLFTAIMSSPEYQAL